ncbi:MAG: 4-hydroxy-tetrahydrodipicolinate synthase [Verrucomicrobia bacterium]|jgi:4-hydroxy-tetrahydrodipicolinate synthase|nr:4-hydroxy-tetrahydrodipicolinate synthase [Verrucomicrobiota bacterium]MDA0904841.1 4-hydroxy-tetrahydrodipicolinate synthase [Verrucomicrobiota bacterium]MDA1077971.1 4-hydroxy-tetrahydrodipicolinate synthase [Verrucomicrobiota bacterium]
MDKNRLHGVHTALVTPMLDGKVAYKDLERLIIRQAEAGVSSIVPCGTTGESPTLSESEHLQVIKTCIDVVRGDTSVIAGTGANSTSEALALTKSADEAGADAFLLVAPYYNKPSQEGLFAHFRALAEVTEKPIVLYSIPSRCGIEISTDTVCRLRDKFPHVMALKEAGGQSAKVSETISRIDRDFVVLSGDDGLTLPFMSCGAQGVVSVASNLVPEVVLELVNHALNGDYLKAREIHLSNYNLFTDLFCEPNPVPVKILMQFAGMIESAEVRLPLTPPSASNLNLLKEIASRIHFSEEVCR